MLSLMSGNKCFMIILRSYKKNFPTKAMLEQYWKITLRDGRSRGLAEAVASGREVECMH